MNCNEDTVIQLVMVFLTSWIWRWMQIYLVCVRWQIIRSWSGDPFLWKGLGVPSPPSCTCEEVTSWAHSSFLFNNLSHQFLCIVIARSFFLTIKVQEWGCKRENEETIILPIVTIIRTPPKPRAPQKVANPTQATVPAFPGNSIQHSPTSLNLVLGPAPTVPTNVVTKKISTYF